MPEPPANKAQMALLVDFMTKNTDIATGMITKAHSKNRWEKISAELNSIGPPCKSWEKWNRVWINYKAKMKVKLFDNRRKRKGIGDGQMKLHSLSPRENIANEILELRHSIMDVKIPEIMIDIFEPSTSNGIPFDSNQPEPLEEIDFIDPSTQHHDSSNDKTPKINSTENKKLALLELQLANQQKFQEQYLLKHENIERHLKELVELKKLELKQTELYRKEKLSLLKKARKDS